MKESEEGYMERFGGKKVKEGMLRLYYNLEKQNIILSKRNNPKTTIAILNRQFFKTMNQSILWKICLVFLFSVYGIPFLTHYLSFPPYGSLTLWPFFSCLPVFCAVRIFVSLSFYVFLSCRLMTS